MRRLIVFAREPLPGRVKSRLAASVGNDAAAMIYEAMLRDVLYTCRGLNRVEVVVFWDCATDMLPILAKRCGFRSLRQCGADLGERMHNAFAAMFAEGVDVCCIIGTDAPDLTPELIMQGFETLEAGGCNAVFGPATDGGYYLLGLGETEPDLFNEIPWGSSRVLATSLAALAHSGKKYTLLEQRSDIDTIDDAKRFCRDVAPGRARLTLKALTGVMEAVPE